MARVPVTGRRHEWVIIATVEIAVDDHEAGRITENPNDVAITWRERAQMIKATAPGCEVCGGMAADVQGTPCPGGDEFERKISEQRLRDRLWTPD